MKKLKNITATEALRLMRLGFTDEEIIQADSQVSESASIIEKKERKTKSKEKSKKTEKESDEDITAKEILKKIEEIKEKHSSTVKKVENFLQKDKKKVDKFFDKKEIEIKTHTNSTDVEDISQQDVDF
jgi:predicted house-cleaning NTP pyrophosphatase (Maf/HAM1 superfamily)